MQQHIYWPGKSDFNTYLRKGIIHNCLLSIEDSVRSDHIYVPARPPFQGGMKGRRNPAEKVPIIPLPTYTSLHHKNIELYFFIYEQNPFLHTKSSNITFFSAEFFFQKAQTISSNNYTPSPIFTKQEASK